MPEQENLNIYFEIFSQLLKKSLTDYFIFLCNDAFSFSARSPQFWVWGWQICKFSVFLGKNEVVLYYRPVFTCLNSAMETPK